MLAQMEGGKYYMPASYLHQAGEEHGINRCVFLGLAKFALGGHESVREGNGRPSSPVKGLASGFVK